jgi:hypothetical protein
MLNCAGLFRSKFSFGYHLESSLSHNILLEMSWTSNKHHCNMFRNSYVHAMIENIVYDVDGHRQLSTKLSWTATAQYHTWRHPWCTRVEVSYWSSEHYIQHVEYLVWRQTCDDADKDRLVSRTYSQMCTHWLHADIRSDALDMLMSTQTIVTLHRHGEYLNHRDESLNMKQNGHRILLVILLTRYCY